MNEKALAQRHQNVKRAQITSTIKECTKKSAKDGYQYLDNRSLCLVRRNALLSPMFDYKSDIWNTVYDSPNRIWIGQRENRERAFTVGSFGAKTLFA